jgi:hypothetical protein
MKPIPLTDLDHRHIQVLIRALKSHIIFLNDRLEYLASWMHKLKCKRCLDRQEACETYFILDIEKEYTKELIGILEAQIR